jgi:hypothetical protein
MINMTDIALMYDLIAFEQRQIAQEKAQKRVDEYRKCMYCHDIYYIGNGIPVESEPDPDDLEITGAEIEGFICPECE